MIVMCFLTHKLCCVYIYMYTFFHVFIWNISLSFGSWFLPFKWHVTGFFIIYLCSSLTFVGNFDCHIYWVLIYISLSICICFVFMLASIFSLFWILITKIFSCVLSPSSLKGIILCLSLYFSYTNCWHGCHFSNKVYQVI